MKRPAQSLPRSGHWRVVNAARTTRLAGRAWVAADFWARLVGLLGRRHLAQGEAILLRPGSAIHTFFMFFPIDVLFLDNSGRVLKLASAVPPFRCLLAPRGARGVLELPAGTIAATDTALGDALAFETG